MTNQTTLIIGANSDIAKALANKLAAQDDTQLIVVSRNIEFYRQALFSDVHAIKIKHYQEDEIRATIALISHFTTQPISNVFICHGVLHNDVCRPEKRLGDFSVEAFNEIINANTITPMLWLKHLSPILIKKNNCKITVFSARVGSISDNKLGGWYSYRASKAALNMLIKSAALELARRATNIKLICFHPGTTNTPLSKPFQKNVPKEKLFSSDFVATQLLRIVENTVADGRASFLDWQGKDISW